MSHEGNRNLWHSSDVPVGLEALLLAGLSPRLLTSASLAGCRFAGRARGIYLRANVVSDLADEPLANRTRAIRALKLLSGEEPIEFVVDLHQSALFPALRTRRLGVDIYFQHSDDPLSLSDIIVNHVAIVGDDPDPDPDEPDLLDLPHAAIALQHLHDHVMHLNVSPLPPAAVFWLSDARDYLIRFDLVRSLSLLFAGVFESFGHGISFTPGRLDYDCEIIARELSASDYRVFGSLNQRLRFLDVRLGERKSGKRWSKLNSDTLLRPVLLRAIRNRLRREHDLLCLDVSVALRPSMSVKIAAHYLRDRKCVTYELDMGSAISDESGRAPLPDALSAELNDSSGKAELRLVAYLRLIKQ